MEPKKLKYKNFFFILGISLIFLYIFLFLFIWPQISNIFNNIESYLAILIIIFRILIFGSFTAFLLKKWFNQEAIYTSDAYFLFSLFFIILIMGKGVDLIISLIYLDNLINSDYMLIFFKIRYIIIVINAIPLLFLGLEVLINLFDIYVKKIPKTKINYIKISIVSVFLIINSIVILISPSTEVIQNILPIITTLTMIGIVILFVLMYKIKRLSQAHGLIIGIGFLFVIISHILRPIFTKDFNVSILIIAEMIDQLIYIIIFIGFIKKPPYIY
ncbi:MAG: hypothetical protein JXA99_00735 [Candidatus Lokiarchaeota archaeon]|nr:hypothetical protein [Candidatus Lokiarchaeota archaeon]